MVPLEDWYSDLPFSTYLKVERGTPAVCYNSLLHFILSEQFIDIYPSYARYLMELPVDELLLESIGVSQPFIRSDWIHVSDKIAFCGIWFLYRAHQSELKHKLISPLYNPQLGVVARGLSMFRHARFERPTKRLLISIDDKAQEMSGRAEKKVKQAIVTKAADEIILLNSQPASRQIEQIARSNYIPVKRYSGTITSYAQLGGLFADFTEEPTAVFHLDSTGSYYRSFYAALARDRELDVTIEGL